MLADPIRRKVRGGTPYIGWSAGSNLACPTFQTTNDMPICEPLGFDALGLVPSSSIRTTWMAIAGVQGETREGGSGNIWSCTPTSGWSASAGDDASR
jgi:peptidase E